MNYTVITQQEGINIFNAAGFEVSIQGHGFHLMRDGKKAYYHSNKQELKRLNSVLKTIQQDSFNKGYKKGAEDKQNEIKKSLGLL